MSDLAIPVQNIDRNEDDAQFHAGKINIDRLDRIRQVNTHPVALSQALAQKQLRQTVAARIQFAEGENTAAELQRGNVAASGQRKVEQVQEIHVQPCGRRFKLYRREPPSRNCEGAVPGTPASPKTSENS